MKSTSKFAEKINLGIKGKEIIMCYRVECKKCGKYTWGGCGNHLKTLYGSIDKGKHCMCQSWPGVVIPSENQELATPSSITTTTTSTGIHYKSCVSVYVTYITLRKFLICSISSPYTRSLYIFDELKMMQ